MILIYLVIVFGLLLTCLSLIAYLNGKIIKNQEVQISLLEEYNKWLKSKIK